MTETEPRAEHAAEAADERPSKKPLVGAVLLAALGLAIIAVVAVDPFDDAAEDADAFEDAVAADVDVDGEALPPLEDPATDDAIGMRAPSLDGTGLDGEPLAIEPADGIPRVILFVAHWCPPCQDEVPAIQQAREAGELRDDVELVAVSTGAREDEENFPPGDWFRDEGWTVPTLVDNADRHAAGVYGLQGYPYWVFVQGDGAVVGRRTGALPLEGLQQLMDELAARVDG